jgi:hypothetical protein
MKPCQSQGIAADAPPEPRALGDGTAVLGPQPSIPSGPPALPALGQTEPFASVAEPNLLSLANWARLFCVMSSMRRAPNSIGIEAFMPRQ